MQKITPTKAETALLEPFAGLSPDRIFVPTTKEEFASAAAAIKQAGVVGFDTESKPVFQLGAVSSGPHVVQFATLERAFIFQLNRIDCHPVLNDLLQSDHVLKVGFGLKSDRSQIDRKFGIKLTNLLDLDAVFRKDGYRHEIGVKAAIAVVFNRNFKKPKKVSTSNWAMPRLTSRQLLYAANDAYAAIRVLNALDRPHAELLGACHSPHLRVL